jgi:hypothetical protein
MQQSNIYNKAAYERVTAGLLSQSATGGTPITTGHVLDRIALHYPMSDDMVVNGTYTASGAATGDYLTVAGTVTQGSTLSSGAIVSPTTLATFSFQVQWVSNASLREFNIAVPLNFNGAAQYIQLSSITLTPTTVGTYSALAVGAVHVLGGQAILPDPLWTDAGYIGFST